MKFLCSVFILIISIPSLAQEGLYEFIERKQAEKKQSRWTLAQWLALKERNGLMDQWLALNTAPNFLDFNIALEAADFDHTINGVTDAQE